ncbi:uncharacterized protein LOC143197089 isoform X2 [Rhynchophorus ferrugineus]|uniref:Uncharacterized protein n=1 Tax=Rhynchophorus ferrugineus TaxID=354439 RepID=A0A834IZH0_RHYFE|nr:hypothetical protein GWI33_002817 [Rhynchophorus ferrugineus]
MDLLDQLADAVKEAAIPNWKTNHYEKIHFLKIGELQKLDKTDGSIEQIFTIKNYFKTEFEENWYLPVIHIAICGTVLEAKVWRNNFWFEILDETGSIACVTDIYNIPWNNLNNNYYIYHRKFRELEAEFKNRKKRKYMQKTMRFKLKKDLRLSEKS